MVGRLHICRIAHQRCTVSRSRRDRSAVQGYRKLIQIFQLLGTPSDETWPGFSTLPNSKTVKFGKYPLGSLSRKFPNLSSNGLQLLQGLLSCDPKQRLDADRALDHDFFKESPPPKDPSMFPSFPSKSGGSFRANK